MILEGFLSHGEKAVDSIRREVFKRLPKLFIKYDIRSVLIGETKVVPKNRVFDIPKKEIKDFSLNVKSDVSLYQWLLIKNKAGGNVAWLADSFINEVLGNERLVISLADTYYLKDQMKSFLGDGFGNKLYEELRFRDMISIKLSSGGNV